MPVADLVLDLSRCARSPTWRSTLAVAAVSGHLDITATRSRSCGATRSGSFVFVHAHPIHEIDDDNAGDATPSVWPLLLATGSGLRGDLAGRISSQRDLRAWAYDPESQRQLS